MGKEHWIAQGDFFFENVHIGHDVVVGPGARFWAKPSKIIIGDKVMFGPDCCIIGGNHDISQLGRFMIDVADEEKDPSTNADVTVEQDVWVGARAIILKGVRIGRGAVVAAGAVVIRSVPPYAVVGGCPARVLKFRWPPDKIIEHEKKLYSPDERLSLDELRKEQESLGIP
jgi:maltose O-acetyltransferase